MVVVVLSVEKRGGWVKTMTLPYDTKDVALPMLDTSDAMSIIGKIVVVAVCFAAVYKGLSWLLWSMDLTNF